MPNRNLHRFAEELLKKKKEIEIEDLEKAVNFFDVSNGAYLSVTYNKI